MTNYNIQGGPQMDKNIKNSSELGLPNFGSHVKHTSNLEDLYREKISNSIKIGFESLSNSLIECALILSSEEYAKSLVKEREAKKKEEETKKKKENEKKNLVKENSEKFLNIYKEKLKNQLQSINASDDEKSELIRLLTTNEVNPKSNKNFDIRNADISIKDTLQIAKKAFCDTLKEVKPEFGKMFIGDSINFDPMMLSMIIPEIELPRITYMLLLLNDKNKLSFDPAMYMLMNVNKPF